jgi:hypothetical protein
MCQLYDISGKLVRGLDPRFDPLLPVLGWDAGTSDLPVCPEIQGKSA